VAPWLLIQSIHINIFIFVSILFIKLSHVSQNMQLEPSQHYSVLSNISSTWAVSLSAGLSGVSEALDPWKWTAWLLRYTQRCCSRLYLTSFPWYCPVPYNGCRLSIYSVSRNLAVRRSSLTSALSSKSCQGCEGPALQKMSLSVCPNKKRCPWSVAAKWSVNIIERWFLSSWVSVVRWGNRFWHFSHSFIRQWWRYNQWRPSYSKLWRRVVMQRWLGD